MGLLSAVITGLSFLKLLDLSYNPLKSQGGIYLGNALTSLTNIEVLIISSIYNLSRLLCWTIWIYCNIKWIKQ